MPNYDYKCLVCEHEFEVFQKMTDEILKECPQCGGNIKRLIGSGNGLIFKGSGFYQTDYKNSKTNSNSKQKTETESESKPKTTESKSPDIKKSA